jgi:hypothetical protein
MAHGISDHIWTVGELLERISNWDTTFAFIDSTLMQACVVNHTCYHRIRSDYDLRQHQPHQSGGFYE